MNRTETSIDSNGSQLLSLSYWSFGLGFGPFIPLIAAWVFRREAILTQQLIQSALIQGLFWVVATVYFIANIISVYNQPGSSNLLSLVLGGIAGWTVRILLFVLSLMVLRRGYLELPVFGWLSRQIVAFGRKKTLKKAAILSLLWPGFGQLFVGKSWLGGILALCQLVTVLSFAHLYLAHQNLSLAKELLGIMGFYWRIGDRAFLEGFATKTNLLILGSVFFLNYFLAFFNLPLWFRPKNAQRRIIGSFGISYILHLGILWTILLMPFIFTKAQTRENIAKRAEQIYEKLKKESELLKQERLKPKIPKSEQLTEKELKFDLSLPEQVKGVNEFSSKPFAPKIIETKKETTPTVGFGERQKPLPTKQLYVKKQTRDSKSYSEYITAKIREGEKDRLIWSQAPKPYSTVIQYTVATDGHISDIRIVQPSGNLKIDSLVVSVVESMSPFLRPPGGKELKVTELFWNTGGQDGLDTEMKRSLATYPDGRVIEQ